jgi:hypothetical protein
MRTWGYTVTEHDEAKPWVVKRTEHLTVELGDDEEFFDWASREWPGERYTVTLDPWSLSPGR